MYYNIIIKMTYCKVPNCEETPKNNNDFCKKHLYMKNYTDEMMKNIKFCIRCRQDKYISENDKSCVCCKNRLYSLLQKKLLRKDY
jgi:hypothetical protein